MILLLLFIAVTADDKGSLERGVFFHEETKILLAEKFVNAQFLVPYPKFDIQITESLDKVAKELQNMWQMPTYRCYLNFTNTGENEFKVDWLLKETKKEIAFAQEDLTNIKQEVSSFLKGTEIKKSQRSRRTLPIAAAVAGAVGLFGTGIMFGASDDCGIMGIFGSCQEKDKTNAENIEKLGKYAIAIGDNLQQLAKETDEKFFRVSKDLSLLHEIQNQIIETQNENWQKIEKQFQVLQDNIHDMRNCDQLLYTRQQVNFNFDTISSLLSLIYSNVKAYRAALFAFQMNIMKAIPSLLSKYIPMSLLPKDSLEQILKVVDDSQEKSDSRLTLAIPKQELLAYYESRLLLDVLTLDQGLLMTMAIPFASRQTTFTLYKAIVVPLPQMDEDIAIKWDVEAEYLAVSENMMETSL